MGNSNFFIRLGAIFGYVACTFINVPEAKASYSGLEVTKYLQQQYKGTVHNADGEVLVGASVRNISKNTVTMTNSQGQFSLSGNAGDIVEFTYTGYKTIRLTLQSSSTLSVTLEEDANELDEIVVVGYNSLKKSNISGAVSTVDMGNAEKRRVQDVSQMLQGQVAGVNVTQSTGQPGDPIDIRVRGISTIGNNSPLFIIDGVPTTNFSFINPADIESMSVLKDASAASIYGSRAAAGVILITTKKGKLGQPKFDVNAYTGTQNVTNLPKMMNTQQYLKTMETAWNNSSKSVGTNPYSSQFSRKDLADTDWLGELFETGKTNSFQVGVSGGSDKIKYLVSTGYYNQNGIVVYDNDKYERLNVRTNLQVNLTDRIDLKTNILLNNESKMEVSSRGDRPGIIRHALLRPPVLSVFKNPSDPTYKSSDPFTDLPFYKDPKNYESGLYEMTQNPIALAYFSNNKIEQFKLLGNAELGISFLNDKSLKFRSMIGIEKNFNHTKRVLQNFGDEDRGDPDKDAKDIGKGRQNRPNMLSEDRGDDMNLTWNNVLTYDKTIYEDHLINALVGTEFINNHTSALNASRVRYEDLRSRFQYLDFGARDSDLNNGGKDEEWALFSLFGSATYSYKNKYSITGNLRADASSRFGPDKKWGYFPSVALGWVLTNEDFIPKNDILNYAKLRLSTGKLGNQSIQNYAYLTLYNREGGRTRFGNPDLSWESTTQNNIGLDFRLLNNHLELNVDAFTKKTNDILLQIGLPAFVGRVDATFYNTGVVENKGFELNAKYGNSLGDNFAYSFGGNVSQINNKITALHENNPRIVGDYTRAEVGYPLDMFYLLQMEGIYQNSAEIKEHQFNVATPSSKPGDVRFKDVNNDGVINDNDRAFVGNPIPKWSYGFFVNLNYKGLDFSVLFQGVNNVDRYNESNQILDFDNRRFNFTTRMLDAWNGEGTSNTLPRLSFDDTGGNSKSTLHLEDASYLRLKNIELGYSFGKYLKKLGVGNARAYVSAQNVFTWTKYKGLDPEISSSVDFGTYPQSRMFLFGLNFSF